MTVLVEDYFHVGAFGDLIEKHNWQNFETRYVENTRSVIKLLAEFDTKATFFVLGWIAEQNPRFVAEISAAGHEVASRGFYHRSLSNLTSDEIRDDLKRSKAALENASGQEVIGYRSAEKLSYETDMRVLRILSEEGYQYDASYVPTRKTERSKRFAHQFHHAGNAIWEFPYSTRNLGVGLLPISGGNYFRQIPYTLMRHAVRDWNERYEEPFVFYFHVWEMDPEQPRISAASNYNKIRHYRKLDKMSWIVRENLNLYDYTSVADFLGIQDDLTIENHRMIEAPEVSEETVAVISHDLEAVSIVIPCYNESESLTYLGNILQSVRQMLNESGYSPQFIFVNDKSTDDTLERLESIFGEWTDVSIVTHEQNQGVAAAILTGIRSAETEIVCSMDCDCTYDPHGLVDMIPLLTEDVDMVTASPYHPSGKVKNVPNWRLGLSKGASFLYRRVLRSKLNTYTSCFRVYRRSSVEDITPSETGFLGVAEFLGILDLRGGRIVEFPATLEVRLFGFSKMKTVRTIFGHLRLLSGLAKQRLFRKNKAINASIEQKKIES